jgi:chromosomal replication initiation ATPase DnaA
MKLAAALMHTAEPLEDLLWRLAEKFGVPLEEMQGKSRHPRIMMARHVAAWILDQRGYGHAEIDRLLRRATGAAIRSIRIVDKERKGSREVALDLAALLLVPAHRGPVYEEDP